MSGKLSGPVVYLAVGGEYSDYRVYAAFATEALAQAFVDRSDSYADRIEVEPIRDAMPARVTWYGIERYRDNPEVRRYTLRAWDFDGPPSMGHRRDSWNILRWDGNIRAFGTDKAAVEKAWTEANAADEAKRAGVS